MLMMFGTHIQVGIGGILGMLWVIIHIIIHYGIHIGTILIGIIHIGIIGVGHIAMIHSIITTIITTIHIILLTIMIDIVMVGILHRQSVVHTIRQVWIVLVVTVLFIQQEELTEAGIIQIMAHEDVAEITQ